MPLPSLPATAFIHPSGHNRAAIAALLTDVAQRIVAHLTDAAQRSPLPELGAMPAIALPELPAETATLLETVDWALRTAMNPAHPGYLGHMDPLPTTASIIGDWVVAALNNNMLSVEMSPLFSRLEPLLMQEIARLFGLGDRAGGLLVSGGSLANLQALAVARNVKLTCMHTGLAQREHPPVFFVSEAAHTSVNKAAMMLGLGTAAAIAIPTNDQSQMEIGALKEAIAQAQSQHQEPFAIVATAGTTVTGNIDPLEELAAIAQAHDLWFHVDAAYGGALRFSPAHRDRLRGIEQADSVTFNPQKWLYVTKTCASVLFRNLEHLHRAFRVAAPYMNADADWDNLGEIAVQGTRHADVLKLWLSLQHLGQSGYRDLIVASEALTKSLVSALQARPFLTLASQPQMNIVCFRGCPDWLPAAQWDLWNHDLQQALLTQADTFVSRPYYRGQHWLKVVLLNPYTTESDIQRLVGAIDQFAHRASADTYPA